MTAAWQTRLLENLARVRADVAAACHRAGRDPADIHVLAVTKYVAPEVIPALVAAGVPDVGENRVQQLVARAGATAAAALGWPDSPAAPAPGPRWHMIGHLQRNKVKALLPHARIIHSLDSQRLAETMQTQAEALDIHVDVFIEVNTAGEASKTGLLPTELAAVATFAGSCSRLRLRGLMTMAPYDPDPEASRPHFARLRTLLEGLQSRGIVGPACRHLSMGMSQDYVVAVAEGATWLRIGSALFEGLPTTDPRSG